MFKYKFGKLPKKTDKRTLKFKSYLTSILPAPPIEYSAIKRVCENLNIPYDSTGFSKLFPLDGNDTLGDCTIAALSHAITVYRGLIKQNKILPENDVTSLYMKLANGQDTGLAELDVLNYWKSNPVADDEILAYVYVDHTNHNEVKQAISLFGGVYTGINVQENAIEDFDAGNCWTPGTLTGDGHAIFTAAYDPITVSVITWGNTQLGTWEWWDQCVEEAYVILPPEAQTEGFTPGFNFEQLKEDLSKL